MNYTEKRSRTENIEFVNMSSENLGHNPTGASGSLLSPSSCYKGYKCAEPKGQTVDEGELQLTKANS